MLSNECFQGTRNVEPVLSCCLVRGKPHPPGSQPAHGQPAVDPGPRPVPSRPLRGGSRCPGTCQETGAAWSRSRRLSLRALDPSAPLLPGRGGSGVCSAPGDLSEQGFLALSGQRLLLLSLARVHGNPKQKNNFLSPWASPAVRDSWAHWPVKGTAPHKLTAAHTPRTRRSEPCGSRLPSPQRLFV